MHAVILAGGRGVRLRPYATSLPKPLVPIGGRYAILEIVLTQLADQGFGSVTLATGPMGHLVRSFVGDAARWGIEVEYLEETQPLGTIGPLLGVLDRLPEHVLVMNGDILTDLDYGSVLRDHIASGDPLTIATCAREQILDYGVLQVESGRVTGFQEKPRELYQVSAGVYGVSTRALRAYPAGRHFGFDELVLDLLDRGMPPGTHRLEGYWLHIGRPDDYERANAEFAEQATRLLPAGVRHGAGECPPPRPIAQPSAGA